MATENHRTPKTTSPAETKKTAAKATAVATSAKARAEAAEARAKRAEAKLESFRAVAVTKGIAGKQVQGFVDFLREQSVVGLAIGLVLGTQVKTLVDQIVKSFFDPLIGLLLPGQGKLTDKTFELTIGAKSADFAWGAFVNTFITFLIVAALVYFVFKGLGLDRLDKKKDS